jgi:putative peptidoglycan lipid II flippase
MNNAIGIGQWWKTCRQGSINARIFTAIVTVGGFTVLVKLSATIKEIVVAYQFGTNDALDAYLIASLLPIFAVNIIGHSLNSAFVPTYIQVREHEGRQAAQRLFSGIMACTTTLLIATSFVLALMAPYLLPVLGSGFTVEKTALTCWLYFMLLPLLVFNGLTTTWGAVLNAGERFALVAMTPMAMSIVTVLVLVGMSKVWGIYALAAGTVSGSALEAVILGWGLRARGISLMPRWEGLSPAVRQVLGQYTPMVAGAFLMSGTSLVGQSMAGALDPGSVSALAYGSKITTLVLGIGAVALSAAVLPHFSKMVAAQDWPGIRHTVWTYARLILIVTLPLTAVLMYFSEPLVELFFKRGAFTQSDVYLVGRIQTLYLLQVPMYVLGIMLVRLISSLKANHLLLWGAGINLSLSVALTYMLTKWMGVAGIALATSLMYLASCSYLLCISLRLLKAQSQQP